MRRASSAASSSTRLALGVSLGSPPVGPLSASLRNATSLAPLTLDASIRFTLENNPQLAALRQQHGVATSGVVIAKTYPFNPIYQGTYLSAKNSASPVANSFFQGHQLTLEVQLFHQQQYRQQQAFAALTRTDWEIATQELTFAVSSVRAFDALVYRQKKLAVAEEFLKLNQKSVEQIKELVERGTIKSGDLILAKAEVNDIQAQVNLSRTAVVTARKDYYRAIGVAEGAAEPTGTLERRRPDGDANAWLAAAMELRPDRFARLAAVEEAEAAVRLQRADRFGNPQVGPVYEYDDSRTNFIGAKIQFPLPLLNRKPGEIQQAEVKRTQAALGVRQTEVEIRQDVSLAAARVAEAERWVESYRKDVLPALQKSLADMEELLQQGQAGVDVLRVLDVRRKLLRAQDGYLDALLAYTSALADLAQAVGDPGLAVGLTATTNTPPVPADPKK